MLKLYYNTRALEVVSNFWCRHRGSICGYEFAYL